MSRWGDPKKAIKEDGMDNLTFGLTMLVVGMGGTVAALAALALIMGLLKKIFPVREETEN
jgi:hypothetical protein